MWKMPTARHRMTVVAVAACALATTVAGSSVAFAGPTGGSDPKRASAERSPRPTPTSATSCDPANPGLGVLQAWVPRSDVNEDRRITRPEFAADAATSFRVWDVNVDDVLSGAEVDRVRSDTANLLEVDASRDDYLCARTDPPAGSGDASSPAGGPPDIVKAVDGDGDGTITAAEWRQATVERYDGINCDGNGYLGYDEALRYGRQEGCP